MSGVILDFPTGTSGGDIIEAIRDEIDKRYREVTIPAALSAVAPTDEMPPEMPEFPKMFRSIKLAQGAYVEVMCAMPIQVCVDYMDGKGPRPKLFGIVCDFLDNEKIQ